MENRNGHSLDFFIDEKINAKRRSIEPAKAFGQFSSLHLGTLFKLSRNMLNDRLNRLGGKSRGQQPSDFLETLCFPNNVITH